LRGFNGATAQKGPVTVRKEFLMEASSGKSRMRLIVVDFLATLFATFCIGVATAIVLAACVVLMTGDAHGATPQKVPAAGAVRAPASSADLILAHFLATRYAGLVIMDRVYPAETPDEERRRLTASRR
jgi:hypothetical protein